MKRTVLVFKPVLAALVLGACSTNPVLPENAWKIAPVQKVRHGGSNAAGDLALGRYREGQGAFEEASAAYRKALDADPKYAPAWNALGTLQVQLGQFDDGLVALERAVQLQPSASHLHNNLGYALLLAGRAEHAVASLRRAVELDGSNQRAWRNLSAASRQIGALDDAASADARAEGQATMASREVAKQRAADERRVALAGAGAASVP
uniref:tetratricopeptide repeat protein n=1 Tax=Aromatoleum sp. TaxID=2307007 RepID=UPI002FCAD57A